MLSSYELQATITHLSGLYPDYTIQQFGTDIDLIDFDMTVDVSTCYSLESAVNLVKETISSQLQAEAYLAAEETTSKSTSTLTLKELLVGLPEPYNTLDFSIDTTSNSYSIIYFNKDDSSIRIANVLPDYDPELIEKKLVNRLKHILGDMSETNWIPSDAQSGKLLTEPSDGFIHPRQQLSIHEIGLALELYLDLYDTISIEVCPYFFDVVLCKSGQPFNTILLTQYDSVEALFLKMQEVTDGHLGNINNPKQSTIQAGTCNTSDIPKTYGKPLERPDQVMEPINDGSSADYYDLPSNARDIQDIIELRNLNWNRANILKAIYRMGSQDHSSVERDLNKILYFTNREIRRLTK